MPTAKPPTAKPPIGKRVIVNPDLTDKYAGIVYVVERHLVKKVRLVVEGHPERKRLDCDPEYLLDAPAPGSPEAGVPLPGRNGATVTTVPLEPYAEHRWEGEVVTVSGPGWREPQGALFVVLGLARNHRDRYRLAKLGGDDGRYFKAVPAKFMTVVDPNSISVALPNA